MRGTRERRVAGGAIAENGFDQHIVRHFVPHRRGCRLAAKLPGARGIRDPGQLFIVRQHEFGGVLCLLACLRHHHGHGFADVARFVGGQQQMRTFEHLAAPGRGELHVVSGRGQRAVRNRLQRIGGAIRAGVAPQHAGHGSRRAGVDAEDARMRMRRAQHRREHLSGQAEVVAELPAAGQEALILFAAQRLADAVEGIVLRRAGVVQIHSFLKCRTGQSW